MAGDSERDGGLKPSILIIDEDLVELESVTAEVRSRYGRSYEVVSHSSTPEALADLAKRPAMRVAVALAALGSTPITGSDLLAAIRRSHPRAKRVLLVSADDWGTLRTGDAVRTGIASGSADHYLMTPIRTGDDSFHRSMSGFLYDWASAEEGSAYEVRVRTDPFVPLAATTTTPRTYDLAIIGAGPAGLAAAAVMGLLTVGAHFTAHTVNAKRRTQTVERHQQRRQTIAKQRGGDAREGPGGGHPVRRAGVGVRARRPERGPRAVRGRGPGAGDRLHFCSGCR